MRMEDDINRRVDSPPFTGETEEDRENYRDV
jgi:hypothetical protein